jgi:hypothetical protein
MNEYRYNNINAQLASPAPMDLNEIRALNAEKNVHILTCAYYRLPYPKSACGFCPARDRCQNLQKAGY